MQHSQSLFNDAIKHRKQLLSDGLHIAFGKLARRCIKNIGNTIALNNLLSKTIKTYNQGNIHCDLLYVVDKDCRQISAIHSFEFSDNTGVGKDLSSRPYLNDLPNDFVLSEVYPSVYNQRSSVSAIHVIKDNDVILGYLVADFVLSALSQNDDSVLPTRKDMWLQAKGDPSIRSTLFMQTRTTSEMDKNIDDVLSILADLIIERGIFHGKIHLSSSRVTLWLHSDPYRYRVHILQELLDIGYLAYPIRPYPTDASVSKAQVRKVLAMFKVLREADETIYLRAASINIINGFVALNFSCDGSHYIPVEEFLSKNTGFWFGDNK